MIITERHTRSLEWRFRPRLLPLATGLFQNKTRMGCGTIQGKRMEASPNLVLRPPLEILIGTKILKPGE